MGRSAASNHSSLQMEAAVVELSDVFTVTWADSLKIKGKNDSLVQNVKFTPKTTRILNCCKFLHSSSAICSLMLIKAV